LQNITKQLYYVKTGKYLLHYMQFPWTLCAECEMD
jgi:hypothetical protein